jgi:hypothetical protein
VQGITSVDVDVAEATDSIVIEEGDEDADAPILEKDGRRKHGSPPGPGMISGGDEDAP